MNLLLAALRVGLNRLPARLRSSPLAQMGLFATQTGDHEVLPILARTTCDYKVPLVYPDEVIVTAKTVKVGRTSFTQAYEVRSVAQGCVSAVGEGIIVCVDKKSGKPVPVPDGVRGQIQREEPTP